MAGSVKVDLAGLVPAYQQVLWVHQKLHSDASRVGIMERAVLMALAAAGEIDIAQGVPVNPLTADDLCAWVGFAPDDVWRSAMGMVHRGWLLDMGERGFALRVGYPVVEEVIESPPSTPEM